MFVHLCRGEIHLFGRDSGGILSEYSQNPGFGIDGIAGCGYQKEFLLEFARLSPTPLEQMESLEQLRALEYGYRIKTILVNHAAIGVDTPEDLEAINEKFRKMGEV